MVRFDRAYCLFQLGKLFVSPRRTLCFPTRNILFQRSEHFVLPFKNKVLCRGEQSA